MESNRRYRLDMSILQLVAELRHENWLHRSRAAEALGECGDAAAEAVPALTDALRDAHKEVRRDAVIALGKIGAAAGEAVPALIALLDDSHSHHEVRKTLRKIGEPAVPALVGLLAEEMKGIEAESVLGAIGKPATGALIAALQSPTREIRARAASALGSVGAEAAEALCPLLAIATADEEHGYVRFCAIGAIERIDPQTAERENVKSLVPGLFSGG